MKLTDLKPRWIIQITEPERDYSRRGMGVAFLCPTCKTQMLGVMFSNPIDGNPPAIAQKTWDRKGETFEDLTVTPSVDCSASGCWHGVILNGQVV